MATLSGGQKQLLNLASIMAMQPEALILDEPTSQLDPIAASTFLHTLRKLNEELGLTILLSEQRLEEAVPLADHLIVLEQGRLLAAGTLRAHQAAWERLTRLLMERESVDGEEVARCLEA